MDGESIPGASGVTEAPSTAEAYITPRELHETFNTLEQMWNEGLSSAKTQEQQFGLRVDVAQKLGAFLDANPTNQMQAEEFAKQEENAPTGNLEHFILGVIAAHAQKAAEQKVTDDEITATGGMNLNEPVEGPSVATDPPVDAAAISRDTQTEPGTAVQSSQTSETPETIDWNSLNRAQKKEALGRHRMDKKPVRPVAPLAVLKDDASVDTGSSAQSEAAAPDLSPRKSLIDQIALPGEAARDGASVVMGSSSAPDAGTTPVATTGEISTQAASVLGTLADDKNGITPAADQEYAAEGTTPTQPNLDALTRTIPEPSDAHGTTPFPEQPYSAKMAEWGKVSGTMNNDNTAAGESTGSRTPAIASIDIKPTIEPLRAMTTDNSATGESTGSKSPAITSLDISPANDAPKPTPEEHLTKLSGEPINMSTDSSGQWINEPISMSTDNSKMGQESELGKLSESPLVAAKAEKLGGRVKEKLKENKGVIARTVAVGMLAFIGLHKDAGDPVDQEAKMAPRTHMSLEVPQINSTDAPPYMVEKSIPDALAVSPPESSGAPAVDTSKAAEAVNPAESPGPAAEASPTQGLLQEISNMGEHFVLPPGGNYTQELINRSQGTLDSLSVKRDVIDNVQNLVTSVLLNEKAIINSQKEGKKIEVTEAQLITLAQQALDTSNPEQQAAAKQTLEEDLGYIIADPPQEVTLVTPAELTTIAPAVVMALDNPEELHAILNAVASKEKVADTANGTPDVNTVDSGSIDTGTTATPPPAGPETKENKSLFQRFFGGGGRNNNATNS